eukprot:15073-Heterococcus_DN1.PRE.2
MVRQRWHSDGIDSTHTGRAAQLSDATLSAYAVQPCEGCALQVLGGEALCSAELACVQNTLVVYCYDHSNPLASFLVITAAVVFTDTLRHGTSGQVGEARAGHALQHWQTIGES